MHAKSSAIPSVRTAGRRAQVLIDAARKIQLSSQLMDVVDALQLDSAGSGVQPARSMLVLGIKRLKTDQSIIADATVLELSQVYGSHVTTGGDVVYSW
jgi:hypothetical protein